ncbi:hypothetical protein B7494_g50 [Chlorociboria aeruginascens]|nr:hypothetical protein B7494_g50 [Chlorociboria aeruginascens]
MAQLPLRIAILETDTPLESIRAKHGTYGEIFTRLLQSAADGLSHPALSSTAGLALTSWDVVTEQRYPRLEDIDAILMSGSKHNSYDNDAWILKLVAFVKGVLDQERVRIIGVCFGHQIVGRAMGVKVARSDGWELSVTAMDLTKKGQEIFGKTALALHQMHGDNVYSYPTGVEELAYTGKCAVQGMYVAKRLITVQGHPEFTEEMVRELLVARHAGGLFDDPTFEDAMERVDKSQDGVVVAQAFLRFLLE